MLRQLRPFAQGRNSTRCLLAVIFAGSLAFSLAPAAVQANHLPSPTGYVNDFANVIPDDEQAVLEDKLAEFDRATGNQIAMATINDLGVGEISDFSVRAFEEWKIGKRGKDNGVLVLAAIKDRKVRIEVGYGLEGSITDAQAGDIIRGTITPAFKQGAYAAGFSGAAGALEQRIAADKANLAAPVPTNPARGSASSLLSYLPFLLFFGVGILSYIGSFFARSKAVWPGGLVGGVAGGVGASALHAGFGVLPAIIGFGLLGLLLDFLLSKNYKERSRRGYDTGFWGGGGGFFGGGGSGGGGFGGFGGGGSGGGGASGDW